MTADWFSIACDAQFNTTDNATAHKTGALRLNY